jgi:hypothetical protein
MQMVSDSGEDEAIRRVKREEKAVNQQAEELGRIGMLYELEKGVGFVLRTEANGHEVSVGLRRALYVRKHGMETDPSRA